MSEFKDPMADLAAAAQRAIDKNKEGVVPQEGNTPDPQQVAPDATIETPPAEPETPPQQVPNEGVEPQSTETPPSGDPVETPIDSEPVTPDETPLENEADKSVFQEDGTIIDWDISNKDGEAQTTPSEVDYSTLASELGIEAATKEDFLSKVNEIKAKAEAPNPMEALPDNLKDAIEIAKQDGDYLEYLGLKSVDYDAYNNAAIVEGHLQSILRDANGNVDTERVQATLDSMSDVDIDVKGAELKQSYKMAQSQREEGLKQKARDNKIDADRKLKAALDTLTDHRGFKLNSTHKQQLYNGISSGDMIAQMFNGSDGKPDMNKVVKAYSDFLFGDRQNEFLRQQATTQAKKEVLDRLSNKKIEPQASPPTPAAAPASAQSRVAQMAREKGNEAFKTVGT